MPLEWQNTYDYTLPENRLMLPEHPNSIRNDLYFLYHRPTARAYNNDGGSIFDDAGMGGYATRVSFPYENYDNGGIHLLSLNTERLTAPIDGVYHVTASVDWASAGSGDRLAAIYLNPFTEVVRRTAPNIATTHDTTFDLIINLSAGDYLTLYIWQTSGSSLDYDNITFSMTWLGTGNTTPSTWQYPVYVDKGMMVLDTEMNKRSNNLDFLHDPPICILHNHNNFAIPPNQQSALGFTTAIVDSDDMNNVNLQPHTIRIQKAGVYLVCGGIRYADVDNQFSLMIRRNGSEIIGKTTDSNLSGDELSQTIASLFYFNAGDFINLVVYHNDSSTVINAVSGNEIPYFCAVFMSYAQNTPNGWDSLPKIEYRDLRLEKDANREVDNLWFLYNKPTAKVYNSEAQTITTATPTAVTFDTERFDNFGMHSATEPTRLTAPRDGVYLLTGNVHFASGNNYRRIYFLINGVAVIGTEAKSGLSSDIADLATVDEYYLQAGDYVELMVYHTHGSDLDIEPTDSYANDFTMTWLSSASSA